MKLPQPLVVRRPDHRAEFERARGAFMGSLATLPFDQAVTESIAIGTALDVSAARAKRELLASALCWNEEHHALTGWIHQQHRRLADAALRLVADAALPDVRVVAWLLQHEIEALKWNGGRERPDFGPLNAAMRKLDAADLSHAEVPVSADGRGHRASVEAQFVRLLLLDRMGTGCLTRPQVEVLDAWLREACGDLALVPQAVEGAAFSIDLAGGSGLRAGGSMPGLHARRLAMAPLEARRRAIVRELQAGRIVPTYGCAAEFRIEEHVAVAQHLRAMLAALAPGAPAREPREAAPGTRVEAFVGLAEILARAGVEGHGVETGQWRALEPRAAANDALDPRRRYLWLCDTSAGGCGFEALEEDAVGLEIGELVGWKRGGDLAIARVTRRVPGRTPGQVFLGLRLLAESALPIELRRVDAGEAGQAASVHLFVPGDDASGRRDAFLMGESAFSAERAFRVQAGDEAFTLRLNRIRGRGRGWVLAGFEIVPPKPALSAAAARLALEALEDDADLDFTPEPGSEPVLQDEFVDPWSREVPLRLLD